MLAPCRPDPVIAVLERILRDAQHAVLVTGAERSFIDANLSAEELLRIPRAELLRLRVDDLLALDRREGLEDRWRAFLRSGAAQGATRLLAGGSEPIEIRYAAVADILPGMSLCVLHPLTDAASAPGLSPREREVVGLVAQGLRTVDIAERLVVSPNTVEWHIRNALGRLGARNRPHLIALALARGEIILDEDSRVEGG
jgi:DNA-binding CsgD family transcriptional regulator